MQYFGGIDIGGSTIKIAVANELKEIVKTRCVTHYGDIHRLVNVIIDEAVSEFLDIKFLFTGNIKLENFYISEIPAIEKGASEVFGRVSCIIDVGASNARFITNINSHEPVKFAINSECAGSTGSFFEDQMIRLGHSIEDFSDIIKTATTIPRISGRCSVFSKTDIIHRQQEGVATPDILLGLCYASVRNFKSSIVKNLEVASPIAICGGLSKNDGFVRAVRDIFDVEEVLVSDKSDCVAAIGASLIAADKPGETIDSSKASLITCDALSDFGMSLPALETPSMPIAYGDVIAGNAISSDTVTDSIRSFDYHAVSTDSASVENCRILILGVDVGSTSTNLVLIDENGTMVFKTYLRTRGNPSAAIKQGLFEIEEKFGDVEFSRIGVTGSGRYLIGKELNTKRIYDEITAQAKSASITNPKVDTIFEIGGQDSKYISIHDGVITAFQMNKVCSAGTGSFIEEQACRLNVPVHEFGEIALKSQNPLDLGDRCTVFIEATIKDRMTAGANLEDVLAGLSYSIVNNFLNRVVGKNKIGTNIVLQGGVCYNLAIVSAFKNVICKHLNINREDNTAIEISVSPYFDVSGAYGAAVLAKEESDLPLVHQKANDVHLQKMKEIFLDGYTREMKEGKQTIGIPYVLLMHKLFPLFRTFFEELGYNVLLSKDSDEEIIALAQRYANEETCFPVKLIYGHMGWLVQQGVDYIFHPSFITLNHSTSKIKNNYGCVYMQAATSLIFDSLDTGDIKLLNPQINFSFGHEAMATALVKTGVSLGFSKELCMSALKMGSQKIKSNGMKNEALGKELIESVGSAEKIFVIITRTYGLEDRVLNLGIANELIARGNKVITLGQLPGHNVDLSQEYDNMYWPFGQHIIAGAKIVKNNPNLYAIHLTNHGCAPDAMVSHWFKTEMGDKPYLSVEVDEHFSKVGVITRIEAFIHSINKRKSIAVKSAFASSIPLHDVNMSNSVQAGKKTYIPNLFPYSQIIARLLNDKGLDVQTMDKTSMKSLRKGKDKEIAKEYLAFSALLGDCLLQSEKIKEQTSYNVTEDFADSKKSSLQGYAFYIPQTAGSETDGAYARVIRDYIDSDIHIASSRIEDYPLLSEHFEQIFLSLLAGDVTMSFPEELRHDVLETILNMEEVSVDSILEISRPRKQAQALIIGDPYIVFNDYLNQNLEKRLKTIDTQFMPMLEYMALLWLRNSSNSKGENNLEFVNSLMDRVADVVRKFSHCLAFSGDLRALDDMSNKYLQSFSGANANYRLAKRLDSKIAVIEAVCTYENTQSILNMIGKEYSSPYLLLEYEGASDQIAQNKISTFLYYFK